MFDGRNHEGFEGDTLASALLANDVHLVGRSFKYHRPRGIFSAGADEPNALVTIDRDLARTTPNVRATQAELYDGLVARSQNRFPALSIDLGAIADRLSFLLPAGFYYKTFMWPERFWQRFYEPAIRGAAGLGHAPSRADPDEYAGQYAHCDVLVIGGGPAGLAAALAASATGGRVVLCDEQSEFGGSLLADPHSVIDGLAAERWVADVLASLRLRHNVTLLPRTTAFGWFTGNMVGLCERITAHLASPPAGMPRERLWRVRAAQIVLGSGATQRPLVFPHNDRPGIMLADAAQVYLHRYGVRPGRRVVVATSHDSAYRVALDLHTAGINVAAIADTRAEPPGPLSEQVRAAGIAVHAGSGITGTGGRLRVRDATIDGRTPVPCDLLLTCGGWTPSVHLFSQARGTLRFDPAIGAHLPATPVPNMHLAGACAGNFGLPECLEAGYAAGEAASRGNAPARSFPVTGHRRGQSGTTATIPIHPKAFVDLQNDVTTRDLRTAVNEGFRSVEHIKRYTTTGMATDQGKTSNINALAIAADLMQLPVEAIGHTTFRAPYTPVTFGALAGAVRGSLFEPVRVPPGHEWAVQTNALFEDVGTWKRARCYLRAGEHAHLAAARECLAVRGAVGVLDASTLGKIEVVGPDAAEFLHRMYACKVKELARGRCRYGVMLNDAGFVLDDGVIARLAHDRFHVTTTTSGAATVLAHLEDYLQTEFSDLRVWLTSTTEQWAVIAVQGPQAPDVVARVAGSEFLDMPHMSVREGVTRDVPMRLFRVSFTGEAGYEINVPAGHAKEIWDAVLMAGAPYGIMPYGTDAMHILRAEKGYVIVGQDTDGTTTLDDLGLLQMSNGKDDFVGKRSLARPDMQRPDRPQLVGLLSADNRTVLEEGAQIVDPTAPRKSLGYVTSAYFSATLQKPIALGLLAGGRKRAGERLRIAMPAGDIDVLVDRPVFYDPAGERLRPVPGTHRPVSASHAAARPPAADLSYGERAVSSGEGVSLATLGPMTRLSVRATGRAATALGTAMGILLGTAPCRATIARDRAALWLGPGEWLVLAPAEDTAILDQASDATGRDAAVLDVSHRQIAMELAGPNAAWCLNSHCPLDLDLRAFPVDMCTRTVFAKAEIVLWRTRPETFHIEIARSFAPYLRQCLDLAQKQAGWIGATS
jgi:sarcosine oxidase subunit alpha